MSDQQSFEFGDDDASVTGDAVVDGGDNHGDRKQLPSGAELRALVCRAVWDAAVVLEPVERAWCATHLSPSDRVVSATLEYHLAQLPTLNGEGLRQFLSTGRDANGVEGAWDRTVQLERSWSSDPSVTPHTDGAASIYRWQRYDFAGPIDCDSVWTQVYVDFDPGHSVDALNDFFDALQAHGANFELEREKITSFAVLQERVPSPEEMLHLAKDRLQPDMGWKGDAITNPWPGFTPSVEELVGGHGIILSEPFEAWRR